jgi:hypothetical protein
MGADMRGAFRIGGRVAFVLVTAMMGVACGSLDGEGILDSDASSVPGDAFVKHDTSVPHDGSHQDGAHTDAKSHPEAGMDAETDTGHDGGHEASTEAGVEAGRDATADAVMEAAHDSSVDSQPPHDTGIDAPVDFCTDHVKDGNETDVDCGGGICPACPLGDACLVTSDCTTGDGCDATTKLCVATECSDGVKDGTETGVDCGGGTCSACGVGGGCVTNADCLAGEGCDTSTHTCDSNECHDGILDGNESAVDCGGGTCTGCAVGQVCRTDTDCLPGDGCDITTKKCDANQCNDGIKDGSETDVDCGGGSCPVCAVGKGCNTNSDCLTGDGCDVGTKKCDANQCNDGIKDGSETDVDCGGGSCPVCSVGEGCKQDSDCVAGEGCDVTTKKCDANECHDGIKNGSETAVDCGGGTCPGCPVGDPCTTDADCAAPGGCDTTSHKCDANECHDGIKDGSETDVDCGGGVCPACGVGKGCAQTSDCVSGEGCDVTTHTCDANECNDGVQDGGETAVDCGGGTCPACKVGDGCAVSADCVSDYCFMSICAPVCTNTTFAATGAVQSIVLTLGGSYAIVAAGSQGGAGGDGNGAGADGALVQATIPLSAGATLQIVVGDRTASTGNNDCGGGGGGSFVWLGAAATPLPASPLVAAGGGAGGGGGGGLTITGSGTGGAAGGANNPGGGGVGWLGAGATNGGGGGGGMQWKGGGGAGGGSAGGFGGGGGSNANTALGCGAGGGYSGGTGGTANAMFMANGTPATGGTSFVSVTATGQMETAATHAGSGSVTITGPLSSSCP